MKKIHLILLTTLFLINFVSAQYIAGDIYLYKDGRASFNLETNLNPNIEGLNFNQEDNKLTGTTELLTTKEKGIWTFSISKDYYKTILIDVYLPNNLIQINSIEGNENIFDVKKEIISIIDSDNNLNFKVSYQLENSNNYTSYILTIIIILVIIIFISFFKKNKTNKNRLNHILPIINDNEKRIVEVLMKKSMRQKEIRKKLDIPKASFARYMINLEKKKLIIREGESKNKMVKLK